MTRISVSCGIQFVESVEWNWRLLLWTTSDNWFRQRRKSGKQSSARKKRKKPKKTNDKSGACLYWKDQLILFCAPPGLISRTRAKKKTYSRSGLIKVKNIASNLKNLKVSLSLSAIFISSSQQHRTTAIAHYHFMNSYWSQSHQKYVWIFTSPSILAFEKVNNRLMKLLLDYIDLSSLCGQLGVVCAALTCIALSHFYCTQSDQLSAECLVNIFVCFFSFGSFLSIIQS